MPPIPPKPISKPSAFQPPKNGAIHPSTPAVYRPVLLPLVRTTAPPANRPGTLSKQSSRPLGQPLVKAKPKPAAPPAALVQTKGMLSNTKWPTPLVQKKAANMTPAPKRWIPPTIQRAAGGPTVITDVFEDVRVFPTIPSISNLRHWVHYGSVSSKIFYAERYAKYGGGSRWEIGFTFYLWHGGQYRDRWFWHVHAEGNGAGKIGSINSVHFKEGHSKRARNIGFEGSTAESLALLADLFRAHGRWVKGDEVMLGFGSGAADGKEGKDH